MNIPTTPTYYTEKLAFKNLDEILVIVSDIVRHHYKQTKGKIGIWGNIVNYVYHHSDTLTYLFDTNGDLIQNQIINESKATLRLNGKNI